MNLTQNIIGLSRKLRKDNLTLIVCLPLLLWTMIGIHMAAMLWMTGIVPNETHHFRFLLTSILEQTHAPYQVLLGGGLVLSFFLALPDLWKDFENNLPSHTNKD